MLCVPAYWLCSFALRASISRYDRIARTDRFQCCYVPISGSLLLFTIMMVNIHKGLYMSSGSCFYVSGNNIALLPNLYTITNRVRKTKMHCALIRIRSKQYTYIYDGRPAQQTMQTQRNSRILWGLANWNYSPCCGFKVSRKRSHRRWIARRPKRSDMMSERRDE